MVLTAWIVTKGLEIDAGCVARGFGKVVLDLSAFATNGVWEHGSNGKLDSNIAYIGVVHLK